MYEYKKLTVRRSENENIINTYTEEHEGGQSLDAKQSTPYIKNAASVLERSRAMGSSAGMAANSSASSRKSFIENIKSKRNNSAEEAWGRNIDLLAPEADEEYEAVYHTLSHIHDLYQPENIIGYTQAASNILPTIYYAVDNLHGHLTQEHSNPMNIGIDIPIKSNNYSFGNRKIAGRGEVLFEGEASLGYSHTSRSKFIPISIASDDKFRELVEAGEKKTTIKRVYSRFGFEFIRRASGL